MNLDAVDKRIFTITHAFFNMSSHWFHFSYPFSEKETFLEPFVLRDLLPSSIGSYYRYAGSLTTPPCSKSVEWIVFSRPVFVSSRQVSVCHLQHGNVSSVHTFCSSWLAWKSKNWQASQEIQNTKNGGDWQECKIDGVEVYVRKN